MSAPCLPPKMGGSCSEFSTVFRLRCPQIRAHSPAPRRIRSTLRAPRPVIVRSHDQHLLLVTQPDHAALADTIMSDWQLGGLADHPQRGAILFATHEHDSGWREADSRPSVDEESGRVLDFVNASLEIRQGI